MEAAFTPLATAAGPEPERPRCPGFDLPWEPPEPCTPAELRAFVLGGENESAACEQLLAQVARAEGALELAIGDGLAALEPGDRLIQLGYSCLGDYAREVLGLGERKAQAMSRLARELRTRPLLRAAVLAGDVRIRSAETVLPVARGDAEARWVERARTETVRGLARAVREERAAGQEEDEEEAWTRLRVRLAPQDRAVVDEALEIAGWLLPGSRRPQRLEAMAQEFLGAFPVEAGDDGGAPGLGALGALGAGHAGHADHAGEVSRAAEGDDAASRRELQEALLEVETERWSFLPAVPRIPAPEAEPDALGSATAIDAWLRELAAKRDRWDALLGYCAYAVRRSGLWRLAGFATFEHYCAERLGLAPRTVEQRAALEKRLWQVPALRAARDAGLSYEKLRLLARLPDREIAAWVPRARALTCVALRDALERHDEAQMRAARVLRGRVPDRVALLLAAAFRAVRAVEGCLLDDGRCLARVARHFVETWRPHVKPPRTRSQRVRLRDLGRCQAPGCSRRATHAHHVWPRARGGGDEAENLVALCACHHLRGIHGGYMRVTGRAPDRLVWEVGGRPFGPRAGDALREAPPAHAT